MAVVAGTQDPDGAGGPELSETSLRVVVGRPAPEKVAVLALPDVVPFSLAVPSQVLAGPHIRDQGLYDLTVCSTQERVPTSDGYEITVGRGLDALDDADLVVVPGPVGEPEPPAPEVTAALRAAHERGARLASLCTGTFVLGDAGLLDGRRVTTHWFYADALRRRFPNARVEPDVLFHDDGDILSSAGLAAGIDLCLYLVASAHGAELANRCARFMVAAPHRPGGQAQYIEHPVPDPAASPLAGARVWMLDHLGDELTLDRLAAQAHMSRRTFTRVFRAETGRSPLEWLLEQRIVRARLLLETTADAVPAIALQAGLGSDAALRHHFRRVLGVSPSAYRRTFTAPSGDGAGVR